jgi:hypothetical protein
MTLLGLVGLIGSFALFSAARVLVPGLDAATAAVVSRGAPKGDRLDRQVIALSAGLRTSFAELTDAVRAVDFAGLFNRSQAERAADQAVKQRGELMNRIIKASSASEVDPVYLMALADKESGFSPTADAARSSALGMFQFTESTWLEIVKKYGAKHGLRGEADAITLVGGQAVVSDAAVRQRILDRRRDPYVAAVMAGEMINRDRAILERDAGREITYAEAYLAYFLGRGSAAKFLKLLAESPKQSAAQAFPAAAEANPTMFYDKNADGSPRERTLGELFARVETQIHRRASRYAAFGDVLSGNSPVMSYAAGP